MEKSQDTQGSFEELLRQQTVLARFGEFTLRSEDLTDILQEACRLVAEGLSTRFAKILELQEGERMLVRAGVGWRPGVVGHEIVVAEEGSYEALALATREPIVVSDVHGEGNPRVSDIVKDHGIESFVNVNIIGPPGGRPYGILEVDSRGKRQFTADNVDFLRTYANLIAAAVQRINLIETLRERAAEKEKLLEELQHRVKNNLQTITSLVRLQSAASSSEDARQELNKISHRIDTLRIVYEKLQTSGERDSVELGGYLADLINSLLRFHQGGKLAVRLITDTGRLVVPVQTAVPLALITNEFITNSLKYAFPEGSGTIGIQLESDGEGAAILAIWDNGRGMTEEKAPGIGMRLMKTLSREVASEVKWSHQGGTRLTLRIKRPPGAKG
jgi:two-component sensor histidine kinase